MRITNRLMTDNSIRNMSETLDTLYNLQRKAATQKKYLRPSENPAVAADNLKLNSTLRMMQSYTNTINTTQDWMETTDFALTRVGEVLTKAQTIALKGLDETYGVDERQAMGHEVDGILQQVIDLANTEYQGRYIFAGFQSNTKPFVYVSKDDPGAPIVTVTAAPADPPNPPEPTIDYPVDSVVYLGDSNLISRSVSANEKITVNMPGSEVFVDSTSGGNAFNSGLNDIFATLIRVRDSLLGADYLKPHSTETNATPPPAEIAVVDAESSPDNSVLREAYANLKKTFEKITGYTTANGARMRNIQTTKERYEKANLEIKSLISQNEDINLAEILSEISYQEVVYQATINISSKIGSMMSLFDALG